MWTKLIPAGWTRRSGKRAARLAATRCTPLCFERLESREVLSVDLAAMAVALQPPATYAIPGQTLQVQTTLKNQGTNTSDVYSVKYYLSKDTSAGSADDIPLGTVNRAAGLSSGAQDNWVQTVTVPSTVTHASYYLGVVVTTTTDADPSNNAVASPGATPVLYTKLSGSATYNGSAKSVSIYSYLGTSTPIYDDRPTWIVIHGRNSSPSSSNLVHVESTLDSSSPGTHQVLVLDWSSAAYSGLLGGAGENYIKPVAAWASSVLTAYGITPDELNLAGHSWGAYVAAELAELEPASALGAAGQVNSIIAMDPAIDYPGGYNPTASGEVNFARNSKLSWAFYAYGGFFGSSTTAATADESFVVKGTDHSNLVNVVADTIARNFGGQFGLNQLLPLSGAASTYWVPNSYDSSGKRSSSGAFEAVLTATSNGLAAYSLKYYNGTSEVTLYS